MKIGIDIDGVITNYEQFLLDYGSKYCYENNIPINVDINEQEDEKKFNITPEQSMKFWNIHLAEYASKYQIRMYAKEIIDKLKKQGHEIYIITARNNYGLPKELSGKMSELTKKWLKDNEIFYDEIFFTKGGKLKTILENNVDIMIDDDINNIKEISTKIPVLCYNAQYNTNIKGKNIIRVYSWYDIYEKIKGMNKLL